MGKRNAVFLALGTFLGVVGCKRRLVVNNGLCAVHNGIAQIGRPIQIDLEPMSMIQVSRNYSRWIHGFAVQTYQSLIMLGAQSTTTVEQDIFRHSIGAQPIDTYKRVPSEATITGWHMPLW